MHRNFWALLAASVAFGVAGGVYEFALPLFLDSSRFSSMQQGVVFGLSAATALVVRVLVARWSDSAGRKLFYSLSMVAASASALVTPLVGALVPQIALKSLRECSLTVRETIHPTLLYESLKERFIDFVGKTTGVERVFQAVGTLAVGYVLAGGITSASALKEDLASSGAQALLEAQRVFRPAFFMAAGLLALATVVVLLFVVETAPEADSSQDKGGFFRNLVGAHLHSRLKLITLALFIFNVGLSTSHCHVMVLIFKDRFGLGPRGLGWVMALHRLSIAIPLLVVGQIIRGRLAEHQRGVYVGLMALEGATLAAMGFCHSFGPAVFFWLMHDFVGAGIWGPIQSRLIQHYARPGARGADVGVVLGVGSLGLIFGPFLGGWLYVVDHGAPFVASGGLMIVTALVLLPLLKDRG